MVTSSRQAAFDPGRTWIPASRLHLLHGGSRTNGKEREARRGDPIIASLEDESNWELISESRGKNRCDRTRQKLRREMSRGKRLRQASAKLAIFRSRGQKFRSEEGTVAR